MINKQENAAGKKKNFEKKGIIITAAKYRKRASAGGAAV